MVFCGCLTWPEFKRQGMRDPTGKGELMSSLDSYIAGAPIRAGGASPLRVATGGVANWRFEVRLRRSPASTNRRRDKRFWIPPPEIRNSASRWVFPTMVSWFANYRICPGLLTPRHENRYWFEDVLFDTTIALRSVDSLACAYHISWDTLPARRDSLAVKSRP